METKIRVTHKPTTKRHKYLKQDKKDGNSSRKLEEKLKTEN